MCYSTPKFEVLHMDRYSEEQEFFHTLRVRPSFVEPLEWIALERYYAKGTPCEPPRESVIKTIAGEYLRRRIKAVRRLSQATMLARKNLPSALKKFRQDMAAVEKHPPLPPMASPWWAGNN